SVSPPLNCDFRIECAILDSSMPVFSIIIAVYNDWTALDSCLHSVTQQIGGGDFEVIVIDDGSNDAAQEGIRQWAGRLPLTFIRQSHAGISTARNHGIQLSKGSILLFVDADCLLQFRWPNRTPSAHIPPRSLAAAQRLHAIPKYRRVRHSILKCADRERVV